MNLQSAQAILIVDDDPTITDTFSRLLQLEGFTVYAALSPEDGLEIAADKQALGASVLFKPIWLEDLLALARGLTAP